MSGPIDALVSELLLQARSIARDVLQREGVRLRTATVTSTSPLRIQYDGEDASSVVPPRRAAVVVLGDRVVVAKSRGQATVLGVLGAAGGPSWNTIPVPSGWTVDGNNYPGYSISHGVCYWSGSIKVTGTLGSGWTTLGYVPVEARPAHGDQTRTLPTSSGRMVLGKIHTNGMLQVWMDQAASGIFFHYTPFAYPVV